MTKVCNVLHASVPPWSKLVSWKTIKPHCKYEKQCAQVCDSHRLTRRHIGTTSHPIGGKVWNRQAGFTILYCCNIQKQLSHQPRSGCRFNPHGWMARKQKEKKTRATKLERERAPISLPPLPSLPLSNRYELRRTLGLTRVAPGHEICGVFICYICLESHLILH